MGSVHCPRLLAVSILASVAATAEAALLNPTDFASLGSLSLTANSTPYTLNTTTGQAPTISGNGVTYTGVISNGVAVFDFDRVSIATAATLRDVATFDSLPVAILSRSSVIVGGSIDVSAHSFFGGPGASFAGFGQNGGLMTTSQGIYSAGGGGGSLGGVGGMGADALADNGTRVAGGLGGATYGDLAVKLQGGSQGAPGGFGPGSMSGGGGGGAIELGAVGLLSVSGSVVSRGGDAFVPGAGGGAGGGIFLHSSSVSLSGTLDVSGGAGAAGVAQPSTISYMGGGGGGGGRILVLSDQGLPIPGSVLIGGGGGATSYPNANPAGQDGSAGVFQFAPLASVPEPSSISLLAAALAALSIGKRWRRVRRFG